MKITTKLLIILLTLISCKSAKVATVTHNQGSEITISKFPKQVGFVNDFENIFTKDEIKFLENLSIRFRENSNKQIAVITIGIIPDNMEFKQYAIEISNRWNIEKDNNGNGLTLVLSKTLRKIRISTTDKTRYYLTDEFCQKVIDKNMIPKFKKGNYYDGILNGLNEIIKKWK